MSETTLIRVSKATKEAIDAKKGDMTVDRYLSSLTSGGELDRGVGTVSFECQADKVLVQLEEIREKFLLKLEEISKARPKPEINRPRSGGGRKCKDTILLEFDQWAEKYVGGFQGMAQTYTIEHVKKFRGWLEGLSLEIDSMQGPGEG